MLAKQNNAMQPIRQGRTNTLASREALHKFQNQKTTSNTSESTEKKEPITKEKNADKTDKDEKDTKDSTETKDDKDEKNEDEKKKDERSKDKKETNKEQLPPPITYHLSQNKKNGTSINDPSIKHDINKQPDKNILIMD
ncbi:hypothetical protein F8M41_026410 [Gigaspora margarita]|uniref:Uncharacterized protein n=1 Tax=Gigaspora margarita TaxID=4874 RepID=A0A8H3XH15_GIGMA|nr:hypothetical protein F8M41_026410 [Gigaspora margarita]